MKHIHEGDTSKTTDWYESGEMAEVWRIMTGDGDWRGHQKDGVIVNCHSMADHGAWL